MGQAVRVAIVAGDDDVAALPGKGAQLLQLALQQVLLWGENHQQVFRQQLIPGKQVDAAHLKVVAGQEAFHMGSLILPQFPVAAQDAYPGHLVQGHIQQRFHNALLVGQPGQAEGLRVLVKALSKEAVGIQHAGAPGGLAHQHQGIRAHLVIAQRAGYQVDQHGVLDEVFPGIGEQRAFCSHAVEQAQQRLVLHPRGGNRVGMHRVAQAAQHLPGLLRLGGDAVEGKIRPQGVLLLQVVHYANRQRAEGEDRSHQHQGQQAFSRQFHRVPHVLRVLARWAISTLRLSMPRQNSR